MTSAAVLNTIAEQHLPSQDASICNIIDIDCFNDYSRLLATSVYVYRFYYCTGIAGPPTTSEIKAVEHAWIKSEQPRCYPQVISSLSSNNARDKTSVPPIVRQLNLFLSEDGLLFAKGRFTIESSLILLPCSPRQLFSLKDDYSHRVIMSNVMSVLTGADPDMLTMLTEVGQKFKQFYFYKRPLPFVRKAIQS